MQYNLEHIGHYKGVNIYYNPNNKLYVYFLSSLAYPSTACVVGKRSFSALRRYISYHFLYNDYRRFLSLDDYLKLKNQEFNPLNKIYKMYLS